MLEVEKRQNERTHTRRMRKLIRREFMKGAWEAMNMNEESNSDDAADVD